MPSPVCCCIALCSCLSLAPSSCFTGWQPPPPSTAVQSQALLPSHRCQHCPSSPPRSCCWTWPARRACQPRCRPCLRGSTSTAPRTGRCCTPRCARRATPWCRTAARTWCRRSGRCWTRSGPSRVGGWVGGQGRAPAVTVPRTVEACGQSAGGGAEAGVQVGRRPLGWAGKESRMRRLCGSTLCGRCEVALHSSRGGRDLPAARPRQPGS